MGVLLSLLSALCYGSSDFLAGHAARRGDPNAIVAIAQPFGIIAAAIAIVALSAHSPSAGTLWWGALSGIGSGIGTVALYWGLSVARMSIVAPVSAVLSATLPAVTGALLGQHLPWLAWVGVAIGVPAVALVSMQPAGDRGNRGAGLIAGLVAGVGFALLFIALDRAGTRAGGWPLLPGQVVASVIVAMWLVPSRNRPERKAWQLSWRGAMIAGALGGTANLLYLAATGAGQLAVIAVITALYPAVTVLLARFILHEHWSRLQALGLLVSAAAVALISAS
ncbi:MAG TPA: DMT family transporter [Streptosporangiaceae bacterium]|nr:DMT family transporter [Streptosporangiaceae bacterium]